MASQSTQPPATNPAPQKLTDSHLRLLLETLNPVASKCHNLGVHLGLSSSQLHAIEHDYRKCEDQLREIISERLRQESRLTWDDIARSLRAVSENRLASEIENKYIHHLPPPTSVAPQTNTASPATSSLTSSLQSSSQCDTSPPLAHSSASVASNPLQYSPHIHSINPQYPPPSTSASPIDTTSTFPQHSGTASHAPSHECFSYSDVIDKHCVALTNAIHGDLITLSNKFVELGFVTRTATDDILSKHGTSSREKANQLLNLVTLSHDRSHGTKEWFDKFTSVFSSEAAYEGLVSELKEASHKMMGSDSLVLRPHHKCSAKTHRKRKVVSVSLGSFSQATKRLQMRGHDSDNEPMKVRKTDKRAEGSMEVKKKRKKSHDGWSSSLKSSIRHGVMISITEKTRVEKRGRGGPTTRAREELSSGEEEVVYQGTEQRSFSEFTPESEDIRQGRRVHEHTSESSSSSAENSALSSSSAEEEEGKRPDSRHASREKKRKRLAMWFTPKKKKLVFKVWKKKEER